MLAVAASSVYGTIAQFQGEHWYLTPNESHAIGDALHNALETLPENSYEKLQLYIAKFAPWVFLAITIGQITYPRYTASKTIRDKSPDRNVGDAGQTSNFNTFGDGVSSYS